jgi:hypothetical protein
MKTLSKTFPRKVVYSPGFGAGIASWWHGPEDRAYDFVEDPAFVNWVENELPKLKADTMNLKVESFIQNSVVPVMVATGRWTEDELKSVYYGGFYQAVVATVDGPYRIREYDGSESIEVAADLDWRW